jgi:hypothetical protein
LRKLSLAAVACANLTLGVAPARAQVDQAARAAAAQQFDRADRESRALIDSFRCAKLVDDARQGGLFGPIDSLGHWRGCTVVNGQFVGVLLDADSQLTRVTRFAAVDLAMHRRRTAPVDTAAMLGVARAKQTAMLARAGTNAKADHAYAPMAAFRFDGDSVEVWLITISNIAGDPFSVGGEHGYIFSPDGRTLAREVDASADFRQLEVPFHGIVHIPSHAVMVPTLSELVLANALNEMGWPAQVTIDMQRQSATLRGRGPAALWAFVGRAP